MMLLAFDRQVRIHADPPQARDCSLAEVAGVRRVRDRRTLRRRPPAAARSRPPPGCPAPLVAIGTASSVSLVAAVTSAATMIWSSPSTTA